MIAHGQQRNSTDEVREAWFEVRDKSEKEEPVREAGEQQNDKSDRFKGLRRT